MAAERIPDLETSPDRHVVLLVEDEPLIRFDIADELRHLGCQVIEAGNANEAIEILQSNARVDLVVTDMWMPGTRTGLDVANAVREERPGVRAVVISGHFAPTDEHKHIIDLFVAKPVPSDQLARAVLEILGAKPARRKD